jgi:DNA-directed RNA polymerase subunit RPC12/RpoP
MKCIHCKNKFDLDQAPDLYTELESTQEYQQQYKYLRRIQDNLNINIITCPHCGHVLLSPTITQNKGV